MYRLGLPESSYNTWWGEFGSNPWGRDSDFAIGSKFWLGAWLGLLSSRITLPVGIVAGARWNAGGGRRGVLMNASMVQVKAAALLAPLQTAACGRGYLALFGSSIIAVALICIVRSTSVGSRHPATSTLTGSRGLFVGGWAKALSRRLVGRWL